MSKPRLIFDVTIDVNKLVSGKTQYIIYLANPEDADEGAPSEDFEDDERDMIELLYEIGSWEDSEGRFGMPEGMTQKEVIDYLIKCGFEYRRDFVTCF